MLVIDFVTVGFNQIVNNLAKLHYRWGENADVVVRMPTGGGSAAGPFHSQSNEAWFTHTPGLKVVYPSSPTEAKGLLTSLEDVKEFHKVGFPQHLEQGKIFLTKKYKLLNSFHFVHSSFCSFSYKNIR